MWNKTEREGKVDQTKGKVEQAGGALAGDLKAEGQVDEAVGNVKVAVGRTARKAGNVIAQVASAAKQ